MAKVHFIQTADPIRYRPLLEISSQTVSRFCSINGFTSETYLGVLRGYHSWQACYNRINLLKNVRDSGYQGWVCYLDADAFIWDQNFDLNAFLDRVGHKAFIAAPVSVGADWWRINSGVFFINLAHHKSKGIINSFFERFMNLSDQMLKEATTWNIIPGDQNLLQHSLKEQSPDGSDIFIVEGSPNLINYSQGLFIRQLLRESGEISERIAAMRTAVEECLQVQLRSRDGERSSDLLIEELSRATYKLLLRRNPDPKGFASSVSALKKGKPIEQFFTSLLRSAEFAEKFEQIVDELQASTRKEKS